MANPEPRSWRGRNVDLTSIERRIAGLARDLAGEMPTLCPVRTHLFNLVVYVHSRADAERAARFDELSQRHASRCIILEADRANHQSSIDAEVKVFSAAAGDSANILLYEQIIVTAHGRSADHPESIVLPLLKPEIPTYLWWPGHPLFGHRIFHRLLGTADQLIVDSAQFASPGDALASLARIAASQSGVNDFNWARLTPWRELFAQFFDGASMLPYLQAIRSVTIELGQTKDQADRQRATSGLLLLTGWMSAQMGWQPETTLDGALENDVELAVLQGERLIPISIQFRDHGPQSAGRFMGLEVVSQPADRPPARFRMSRSDDLERVESSVEVHGDQPVCRVVPLGIPGDEQLLAEELTRSGRDRLYQRAVLEASRLAGRDVWLPA